MFSWKIKNRISENCLKKGEERNYDKALFKVLNVLEEKQKIWEFSIFKVQQQIMLAYTAYVLCTVMIKDLSLV